MDTYGDEEVVREQVGVDLSNDDDLTFDVNADTTIDFAINSGGGSSISVNNPMSVDKNFDYYGGCRECYQYSMLFGRVSNNIGVVNNEEEFEKYKMKFVAHFNEKHRDLFEWRKNGKKGKKPITNKEEIARRAKLLTDNSMSFYVSDGTHTLTMPAGVSMFYSGEAMQITTPAIGIVMPQRDHDIIGRLERTGYISERDRKRLDKKYGESIVNKARKKYNRARSAIRGWRS